MEEDVHSCEEIKSILSAYFDNETSDSESKKIQKHLSTCSCCNDELKIIKKISSLISTSLSKEKDNQISFVEPVMNRLCNENPIYCEQILLEADNYFRGKIDLKLHYLIEEHLEECLDCQVKYSKFM